MKYLTKNQTSSFPVIPGFDRSGPCGNCHSTLVASLLFKDDARETTFALHVLLFVLEEQLLFHLYTHCFLSGQLPEAQSSPQSLRIRPLLQRPPRAPAGHLPACPPMRQMRQMQQMQQMQQQVSLLYDPPTGSTHPAGPRSPGVRPT